MRARGRSEPSFDEACALLEEALAPDVRQHIVNSVSKSSRFERTLSRLRAAMRDHRFSAGPHEIDLASLVRVYDRRSRHEGFHALNDWDGKADQVNEDIIPVDVLTYIIARRGAEPTDRAALAILIDYYFFHLLTLLSLRVWDDGDADANLDRLRALLDLLQGPGGSGQRFVTEAATLMLIATSHFERREDGYHTLLQKVRMLSDRHQAPIALGHASSIGCHLRFGFEATYGRDEANMRGDNVADYPWLCFALTVVMRAYAQLQGAGAPRDHLVEALLNGLTPDPRAFVITASSQGAERDEFRSLFHRYRTALLLDFERHRPHDSRYSPLAFFFNFSHNVLKGLVVDAVLRGEPWDLTFDDLLTGLPADETTSARKGQLARTLMEHARSSPDRIRGELVPAIVYDARLGYRAFETTLRYVKQL